MIATITLRHRMPAVGNELLFSYANDPSVQSEPGRHAFERFDDEPTTAIEGIGGRARPTAPGRYGELFITAIMQSSQL